MMPLDACSPPPLLCAAWPRITWMPPFPRPMATSIPLAPFSSWEQQHPLILVTCHHHLTLALHRPLMDFQSPKADAPPALPVQRSWRFLALLPLITTLLVAGPQLFNPITTTRFLYVAVHLFNLATLAHCLWKETPRVRSGFSMLGAVPVQSPIPFVTFLPC